MTMPTLKRYSKPLISKQLALIASVALGAVNGSHLLHASDRAADLEAQRAALDASLENVADADTVKSGLQAIMDNHGITGHPYLFRIDDIPSVPKQ